MIATGDDRVHVQQTVRFVGAISCSSSLQWSRGLRRGSSAARLLGMRVLIPPGAWTSVPCEYCVLSGSRGSG